uniref:Uncharacterized protein n=1 Tax=Oryza glumipatula TaxID=40148 RepID=A0A0E0BSQ5_9ORYZ
MWPRRRPELAAAPDLGCGGGVGGYCFFGRSSLRLVGLDDVSVKVASDGALTGLLPLMSLLVMG